MWFIEFEKSTYLFICMIVLKTVGNYVHIIYWRIRYFNWIFRYPEINGFKAIWVMLFFIFAEFILLGIFDDSSKFFSASWNIAKKKSLSTRLKPIFLVIPKTLNLGLGYTGFVTLWLSSYWILLLLVCMSRNNFLFVFPYYYIILNHFENRNVLFTNITYGWGMFLLY